MGIEGGYGRFIRRACAEPHEAVRPDEESAAIGNSCFDRIELSACGIDDRHEPVPARAKMLEARRGAGYDEMVARAAQAMTGTEAASRQCSPGIGARRTDERASCI